MQTAYYHLVGIAGSGMNALAQLLRAQGHAVSGSDRSRDSGRQLSVLSKLEKSGVTLVPQDGSSITTDLDTVIISSAIEQDNPDVVAAERTGVPVCGRGEMLARLTNRETSVAIAGTSGKTTVTGMVGWILEQLGADPTVVNGGNCVDWVDDRTIGNVRIGDSGLWVVEADESDRSLLHFRPDYAVITNISQDHFSLSEVQKLFGTFSSQVKSGIVRGEDDHTLPADSIERSFEGTSFLYDGVRFKVLLPGSHNVENAVRAISVCHELGHSLEAISGAISSFRGMERRLETVGVARGITVIDDYAHNPAKIRAAWESVGPYFERVLSVWRPHGFGPLSLMMDKLVDTFAGLCRESDSLCVLPVYYAGGTATREVDSRTLVEELKANGVAATLVTDYDACAEHIVATARSGDAVLSMGARDPDLPSFARSVVASLST